MFEKKLFLLSMPLAFFMFSCFSNNDDITLDDPSSSSVETSSSSDFEDLFLCSGDSEGGTRFEMIGLAPGSDFSEVNFNWYSANAANSKKSFVRIFESNGDTLSTTSGISGNAKGVGFDKCYHKATVKGLTAGSSYKYSVSSDGVEWSDKYDYKVPPAAGVMRFAIISDPQITTGMQDAQSKYPVPRKTTAAGWAETLDKVAAANVSFIVSGGDQLDNGSESEYERFYAPVPLRSLPLAPVVGNNDPSCSFMYHFNLPNEYNKANYPIDGCKTSAGVFIENVANYYYLYNNILFVGLNTSPAPRNTGEAMPYITNFTNTIRAAKAANAGKYNWLVVHHHKPTNSVAGHARDADVRAYVEAGFQEMMTVEGVDLVIGGHDHIYVRSKLMKNDHPSTDGKGTMYLAVTSASGGKYYAVNPNTSITSTYPYFNQDGFGGVSGYLPESVEYFSQNWKPEYTIVDVDGTNMTVKTYTVDSDTPHDEFTFSPTLAK